MWPNREMCRAWTMAEKINRPAALLFLNHLMSLSCRLCGVSDGSTSSATALRGRYGCAGIHDVTDFYDSSPFVSRSTTDPPSCTAIDITACANDTQSALMTVAGRKGSLIVYH